jgi:magnesium transporter
MIGVRVLRDGHGMEEIPIADLAAVRGQPGTLIWVEVVSPTPEELATLGREFGIHEVAGENYLITSHGGGPVDPTPFARRVKARKELAREGAGYLLYVALDELVDTFFPALDAIGERLVEVEEAVLGGTVDVQGRILAIRKELIEVRRVVGPMRDAMVVLLRRDLGLFSDEAQRYLQDVYDHLIRVTESVEDYQEVLAGTLDANATMASNRVNTVARNLAAYAAIFAVITMISGVYGMNFHHMPELGWRFGYAWAVGLMVLCAGGLWVYFKRKGWL